MSAGFVTVGELELLTERRAQQTLVKADIALLLELPQTLEEFECRDRLGAMVVPII